MDLCFLGFSIFFSFNKGFSVCRMGNMHSISWELEFSGVAYLFSYLYVCFSRAWFNYGVVWGSLIKMLGNIIL